MDEIITISHLINAWFDSPSIYARLVLALPLLPCVLMVIYGLAQLIALKD